MGLMRPISSFFFVNFQWYIQDIQPQKVIFCLLSVLFFLSFIQYIHSKDKFSWNYIIGSPILLPVVMRVAFPV